MDRGAWCVTTHGGRRVLIEYTQRFRDAGGLSQSHVAGLGTRPGSLLLGCPIPPPPLPPAALQVPVMHLLVHQTGAEEPVGIRGGECANWPGTGVAGGRRGRTQGPAGGGRGQVPLLFQGLLSSLTLQTAKHTTFCGHRGLFQLFISAQSAHLPSLYIWPCPFPKGPANTGPPSRPCWLGQGPTALVQLIFQALLSGSIHFTIGTWSPCILRGSKGKPCSISMMVL